MRKSFITFLACLSLIVAVASCTTSKQTAITRLERFSYELRDNGQYYSFKDWERAADEFTKIRKTIGMISASWKVSAPAMCITV